MNCQFCEKTCKHNNSKAQHELRCSLNPNRRNDLVEKFKLIQPNNTGKSPWNKGLNKASDERLNSLSKKLSISMKGNLKCTGKALTLEKENLRISKIRDKINQRYSEGWEVKCGRAPKLDYESLIAGKIKIDGSWELAVAKYLDLLKVRWIRNKQRFVYYVNNKSSTYCPDFYVFDWNCFIEVKGYQTKLDEIKWNQFPHQLEIWKKEKLKNLKLI